MGKGFADGTSVPVERSKNEIERLLHRYVMKKETEKGFEFRLELADGSAYIDWVIVGGESGPNYRPMSAHWPRLIRDQCRLAHVPFFFKQWGGPRPKSFGRILDGREWNEMPAQDAAPGGQ